MNIRFISTACLTVTLICGLTNAYASKSFYKWVDAQGVTHYSASPPAKETAADATTIRATNLKTDAPVAPPATAPVNAPSTTPPPLQGTIVKDKSPEQCKQAKDNLKSINENRRLRLKDDKTGDLRYLTPEEIQQQKDLAQKKADDNC